MYAINHVTSTPVLRPLLTLDKEDIIKRLEILVLMKHLSSHLKIAVQSLHLKIL